ncbi:MAG: ornithine racemase Orr [Anaeromicrobium sp.]|jgi:predicted amino acid racemase|uniref:ornithine racemase Orr n=1 Tax=Anaeromicrobium sp. TaxID=1929132 RepID=UPI0025F72037|nr:ornithine racemase Orr [Anaeromicrobium sp.]MCT4595137.1 ornithine racemase Orr [Anaeromicrobium sp.]
MKKCPRIEVNLEKLKENTKTLVHLCSKENIRPAIVTKAFCGDERITRAIVEEGIDLIGDARTENLKNLAGFKEEKLLLRLPMMSEISHVIDYVDISLNSEIDTMKELSKEALRKNKVHKVVLMLDLGDLREGVLEEDIFFTVEEILKLKGIKLIGVGTNLTCFGAVIPDEINLGKLERYAKEIEKKFNIELSLISGGNSSSVYLIGQGRMPKRINNVRLGEAILLGNETAYGEKIENTHNDVFQLVAQIIELKEKPSVPIGEIGKDAFGNVPLFEDRGIRERAILGVGKQDIMLDSIYPIDENIIILGSSSDHLIVDVTDCPREYKIGDEIKFNMAYGTLLRSMTSKYVHKEYL